MFENLFGFDDWRLTDILIKDRAGQAAALGLDDVKEVCPFLAGRMAAGPGKSSEILDDGPSSGGEAYRSGGRSFESFLYRSILMVMREDIWGQVLPSHETQNRYETSQYCAHSLPIIPTKPLFGWQRVITTSIF